MAETNIVRIHGKEYMTVAGKLKAAHDSEEQISITTELLPVAGTAVVKATVVTKKGTFTGISAVALNSTDMYEKDNFYEVAETSAIGRALKHAGYGIELGSDDANKTSATSSNACTECKAQDVPESVVKYSVDKWGKVVCYKCQPNISKYEQN